MEFSEGGNAYGSYGIQAASCNWKVWGAKLQNGQGVFIWGGDGGVNLPGIRQLDTWYRLEIKATGDNISFYIDGDLVYERKDSSNASGGVLLWSFDAVAEFDNVVITGDDVPDVGPSGYAVEPRTKLTATWGWIKR